MKGIRGSCPEGGEEDREVQVGELGLKSKELRNRRGRQRDGNRSESEREETGDEP